MRGSDARSRTPGQETEPQLLFDGLGLIAIGVGGRRIVSLVSDQMAAETLPDKPSEEDQNQSKN